MCCQVGPSKLFRGRLPDFAESIPRRQVPFDTTPLLQELGRLFECPLFPAQFIQRLVPLVIFLETNFEKEINGTVPPGLRHIVLGRDNSGVGEII
jgi:hypothetical protein